MRFLTSVFPVQLAVSAHRTTFQWSSNYLKCTSNDESGELKNLDIQACIASLPGGSSAYISATTILKENDFCDVSTNTTAYSTTFYDCIPENFTLEEISITYDAWDAACVLTPSSLSYGTGSHVCGTSNDITEVMEDATAQIDGQTVTIKNVNNQIKEAGSLNLYRADYALENCASPITAKSISILSGRSVTQDAGHSGATSLMRLSWGVASVLFFNL